MTRMRFSAAALFVACAWSGLALAAPPETDDPVARYQAERAVCLSGQSHQARDTCLREAGAALAEARRGRVGSSADYRQNALTRCQALPEADRADCRARVDGEGRQSGSVESGGIYKETVTRSVGTPEGQKPVAP